MQICNIDDDQISLFIENYRKRLTNEILKIKPLWASGSNVDKLMDSSLHPLASNYEIYFVNLKSLIDNVEFYDFDMTLLFTGDIASDYRVATTLQQWENGGYIDPPTISIGCKRKKLMISDGRHRTKIAFFFKEEKIPIAVHKHSTYLVKEIISLTHLIN